MGSAPNYLKLRSSRVVSQLGRLLERHLAPGWLLPSLPSQCAVCCQRGALLSKATGMLINQMAVGFFLGPKGK